VAENLQKGPDGLLGALDLKTTGRNPHEFPSLLQGVFECQPFYLLRNRRVTSSAAASFVAINTMIGFGITVPQDEVWHVKCMELFALRNVADAAVSIDYYLTLRRNNGAAGGAVFQTLLPPVAATDLSQFRGQLCDLWCGPGDHFRPHVATTITAAATNFVVSLDIDAMPSG